MLLLLWLVLLLYDLHNLYHDTLLLQGKGLLHGCTQSCHGHTAESKNVCVCVCEVHLVPPLVFRCVSACACVNTWCVHITRRFIEGKGECECVCVGVSECVSEREREREREREIYIIEKHDIGEHVFQSDRCRDLHPMLCGITRVTARTPPGIAHTHTYTHRHTPLSLPSRNLSTKKHRQNLNLSEDTHTYTHTSIPATLQFKEAGKTQPKVRHKRSRRLACCWLVAVMRL